MKRVLSTSKRHSMVVVLVFALGVATLASIATLTIQRSARADAGTIPMLLVHGYGDNCADAFSGHKDTDPHDTNYYYGLKDYLVWKGIPSSDILEVGYYNDPPQLDNTCSLNANAQAYGTSSCTQLPHHGSEGTFDEPLQEVACQMAWYIYQTYTVYGNTVNITTHSMGGLVIRDAIAESGVTPGFPQVGLYVNAVFTVAAPNAGIDSNYFTNMQLVDPADANHQQVYDMRVGGSNTSAFMAYQLAHPNPQGRLGTTWAAMGASIPCSGGVPNADDAQSCFSEGPTSTESWPDGDGVLQASSEIGMNADLRVLYGMVKYQGLPIVPVNYTILATFTADINTEYRHGIGCSGNGVVDFFGGCETAPFYLFTTNLSAADTQTTKAWSCNACGSDLPSLIGFDGSNPLNYTARSATTQPSALRTIYNYFASITTGVNNPVAPPTPTATQIPPTATPTSGYEGNRNAPDMVGWEAVDWNSAQKVTASWYVPKLPVRNFSDMDTFVGFNGDTNQVGKTSTNGYFVREGVDVSYDDVGDSSVNAYWEVHDNLGNFITGNSSFYQPSVGDRVGLTVWYSGTTVNFDFYDQNTNYSVRNSWTAPSNPGFKEYTADWAVTHDEQYLGNWNNTGFTMYSCQLSNNGTWYPISFNHYYSDTLAPNGKRLATPGSLYSSNTAYTPTWIIGS